MTNRGLANSNWAASSEFGTYRLCEQRRFRRACASTQSRQNLRCLLIQAVSQEEPSNRKPDPWPLWMAEHAQLKFVITECSKTQIRLTRHNWWKYGYFKRKHNNRNLKMATYMYFCFILLMLNYHGFCPAMLLTYSNLFYGPQNYLNLPL